MYVYMFQYLGTELYMKLPNSLGGFCFFHQPTLAIIFFFVKIVITNAYLLFSIDCTCQSFDLTKEIACPLLCVGRVNKLEVLPTQCPLPLRTGGQSKIHPSCSVYTNYIMFLNNLYLPKIILKNTIVIIGK